MKALVLVVAAATALLLAVSAGAAINGATAPAASDLIPRP
jgi:hypothetical protein